MGRTDQNSVLGRKTSNGRSHHEARAMPPAKALRLALARAADRLLGLPVSVLGVGQDIRTLPGVLDGLSPDMLLMLIEGPAGAAGVVGVDGQTLSACVEMQFIGRVARREAPVRSATRTDAAIIAPLIDAMLAGLAANLAGDPDGWWADGFAFAEMAENTRTLGLVLSAAEFRCFQISVDYDAGAKTGSILLAVPVVARGDPTETPEDEDATPNAEAMMSLPVELGAELARVRMTLAEAERLSVGDLIELPLSLTEDVRLRDRSGTLHAKARLGQSEGFLALRLMAGISVPAGPTDDMPSVPTRPEDGLRPAQVVPPTRPPVPMGGDPLDEDLPDLPPLALEDEGEEAQVAPPVGPDFAFG